MKYSEILSKLGKGQRSWLLYETFIVGLLAEHLNTSGKVLLSDSDGMSKFHRQADAIAPDGIDELIGPTLIEIKRHSRIRPSELIRNASRMLEVGHISSVLLIVGDQLRVQIREQLKHRWLEAHPNVQLRIWDSYKLSQLVDLYSENIHALVNQLGAIRLKSVVSRPEVSWENERESRIQLLSSAYSNSNISLFLGAGVSVAAGLPSWDTLLDSLFVNFLTRQLSTNSDVRDEEIEQLVKRLKNIDDPSPLMTARYLRRGLIDPEADESNTFQIAISDQLYRKSRKTNSDSGNLLSTLARMCHPRRSGAKVKAVVTFNYDDLLEQELDKTGDFFRSVFREADIASIDELPIYHVHGFLPEDRSKYENLNDGILVLSEEGYHELYGDSYNWSNLVQLNLLRESTCLFVGLSLTDPNLRRLLEIAARKGSSNSHFAFMKRFATDSFINDNGKKVVRARKSAVNLFLRNHHRINEELFQELGITLIWFDDFTEIPLLLERIKASGVDI